MKKNIIIALLSLLSISLTIAFSIQSQIPNENHKNEKIIEDLQNKISKKDEVIKNKSNTIKDLETLTYYPLDERTIELLNSGHDLRGFKMDKERLKDCSKYNRDTATLYFTVNDFYDIYNISTCYSYNFFQTNRGKRVLAVNNINILDLKELQAYDYKCSAECYWNLSEQEKIDRGKMLDEWAKIGKQKEEALKQLQELNKLIEEEDKMLEAGIVEKQDKPTEKTPINIAQNK